MDAGQDACRNRNGSEFIIGAGRDFALTVSDGRTIHHNRKNSV